MSFEIENDFHPLDLRRRKNKKNNKKNKKRKKKKNKKKKEKAKFAHQNSISIRDPNT